ETDLVVHRGAHDLAIHGEGRTEDRSTGPGQAAQLLARRGLPVPERAVPPGRYERLAVLEEGQPPHRPLVPNARSRNFLPRGDLPEPQRTVGARGQGLAVAREGQPDGVGRVARELLELFP